MRGADRVVTLTEAMKEEIATRGVDPARVVVVPNAVDGERFAPRARDPRLVSALDLEGHTVLGYVSNLTAYESIETLLRAIAILRERGLPVAGLIVGDGPMQEPLDRLVHELDLERHVRMTGRVPHEQVQDYYALIDLFVVSRRDLRVCHLVSPLKPFEAMAMGLPVLASDVTALREVVGTDRGMLFVPEDERSLADQAEPLVRDESLRHRLGAAGLEWVRRERTWHANAERYARLYDDVRTYTVPVDHS
jgi:glycosyltransferase involved in cell wall biosynthesis